MNPKVFLQAARYLHEDPERYDFCPLRAILVDRPGRRKFMEMYVARAFFVYLYRPKRVKPGAHWWPKEIDGPLLALLLAAEAAKTSKVNWAAVQ